MEVPRHTHTGLEPRPLATEFAAAVAVVVTAKGVAIVECHSVFDPRIFDVVQVLLAIFPFQLALLAVLMRVEREQLYVFLGAQHTLTNHVTSSLGSMILLLMKRMLTINIAKKIQNIYFLLSQNDPLTITCYIPVLLFPLQYLGISTTS
jgi:hypothetical protein